MADDEVPLKEGQQAELSARALALIREHFDLLNEGNLAAARRQLFFPRAMTSTPLTVYVETMAKQIPFKIQEAAVVGFEGVRPTRHGSVVTIWVDVSVSCALGERHASFSVWWFPAEDTLQISARPTAWVLERSRGRTRCNDVDQTAKPDPTGWAELEENLGSG